MTVLPSGLELPEGSEAALEASARWGQGDPYKQPGTLPLPELDMSLPVEVEELSRGRRWPPDRCLARARRGDLLHDAWRGDLSSVMNTTELADAGVTATNLLRRIVDVLSRMVVRTPPETAGPARSLPSAALGLLTQMAVHGAGGVLSEPSGWRMIDSRRIWWTPAGDWLLVEPRTLDTDTSTWHYYPRPDHQQVTRIGPGGATRWLQRVQWTTYSEWQIIGDPERSEPISVGFGLGERPPVTEQGVWGLSLLEDLLTLAVQHARSRARDTEVVAEHSAPLLALRGQLAPWQGGRDGLSKAARDAGVGQLPDSITDDVRTMALLRRHGLLPLADHSMSAEYLTWDGNLDASMAVQARIDADLRLMSGVTAILGSEKEVPSGMSLKRLFYVADAEAAALRLPALQAIEDAAAGEVTWPDAFSEVDAQNRQDVEDEARADRGQNASAGDERPS